MNSYRTLLVPYDFSEHSRAALDVARDLATRLESRVILIHVIQPPAFLAGYGAYGAATLPPINMAEICDGAFASLQRVIAESGDAAETHEAHVVEGSGVATVLCEQAAALDADLIVMGTHGRTGLAHAFLGSVAERTLRNAPCPVVTVRSPEEKE